jgi:hypothetical protein
MALNLHGNRCSGCPSCPGARGAKYRRMLSETSEETELRLTAENRTRGLRSASHASLRTGIAYADDQWRNHFERVLMAASAYVPEPTMDPNYRPYGTPPDPYRIALALAKVKREDRS